jgi:hypothetical protein
VTTVTALALATDTLTAWATFAAVVVALGLSVVPAVWRWHKRPMLEWSVGRNELHRMAEWEHGLISAADLRICVCNKQGYRRAQNVRALLRAVWVNKPQQGKRWGNLEIDLTPLRWATRRDEEAGAQQVTMIPSGGIDFATFAQWDRQLHSLVVPHARKQDSDSMRGFGPGSFKFHVVVTADGNKPMTAYFTVSTKPEEMTAVERSEAPDPEEVYSYGIYTTLDRDER